MSEQLQLRRGTASQVSAFTGAPGEVVVDATNNRLVVQDGATAGGFPHLTTTGGEVAGLGIGTALDPANALSVYGTSALFSTGGSFNVTVNKAAAMDTASFIFEDGFSARAEIGLCGDDNFHFKVSPDGSTWNTGLVIDAATGAVAFGNSRTAVADANYTALATDRLIAYTAVTAARIVTLPAASAFPPGLPLVIVDESGAVTAANSITIGCAGSDGLQGLPLVDTGAGTEAYLLTAYSSLILESNGSSEWTIIAQSSFETLEIKNPSYPGYILSQRAIGAFPVPALRPAATNSLLALDIMPNGTPVESASNGFSWFDVCAQDCVSSSPANLQSARVGVTSSGADFGSRAFGTSAVLLPIIFSFFQQGGSWLKAACILTNGNFGIGTMTPAQVLDVYGAIAISGATSVGADRTFYLGSFTVGTLPAPGNAGRLAFASNARMYDGAGTLEGVGTGTGGLVVDNGSAWKIAGTNQTIQA